MKHCIRCNETKPITEFNKNRSMKDGLQVYCNDCRKEIRAAFYVRNKDSIFSYNDKWRDNNRDRVNAARRKRRNPIIENARTRAWGQANPEKLKINRAVSGHRRRVAMRTTPNPVTSREWTELLEEFNYSCFWCRGPYEQMDHLVPLSKGGLHTKSNVVPSCALCNAKKKDKDPLVFLFQIRKEDVKTT